MFDINYLSLIPYQVVQVANPNSWQTFRSQCRCIHTGCKKKCLQMELRILHKDFYFLYSHVTIVYLTFMKQFTNFYVVEAKSFTLFRMGIFWDAHGWGRSEKDTTLHKISHTSPTMIKLDTVIPYLKKIQKIHESSVTSADISIFSPEISKFCCIKK